MVGEFAIGDIEVDLWYFMFQIEKVQIGCGECRDPTLVHIFGPFKLEYCIIVAPPMVFESMAQQNLFCPSPRIKCCNLGIDRH
jgi:hypothetical protein